MKLQDGRILTAAFPDVNLAVISTSLEKKFLESSVPLGWVGTSPKSVFRDEFTLKSIRDIPYICGNYDLGAQEIWFWGYLLSLSRIRAPSKNRLLTSKIFMSIMFGKILYLLRKDGYSQRENFFFEVVRINKCSRSIIMFFSVLCSFLNYLMMPLFLASRVCSKLYKSVNKKYCIGIKMRRSDYQNITLTEASNLVEEATKGFF
jgi:hypothetical protein